jgi:hypothetical protein
MEVEPEVTAASGGTGTAAGNAAVNNAAAGNATRNAAAGNATRNAAAGNATRNAAAGNATRNAAAGNATRNAAAGNAAVNNAAAGNAAVNNAAAGNAAGNNAAAGNAAAENKQHLSINGRYRLLGIKLDQVGLSLTDAQFEATGIDAVEHSNFMAAHPTRGPAGAAQSAQEADEDVEMAADGAAAAAQHQQQQQQVQEQAGKLLHMVSRQLDRGNVRGASQLCSEGLKAQMPLTPAAKQQIDALFFTGPGTAVTPEEIAGARILTPLCTAEEVTAYLQVKKAQGKAGDSRGMKAEHVLNTLTHSSVKQHNLHPMEGLLKIINGAATGSLPQALRDLLMQNRGIGLDQGNGKFRPIVLGSLPIAAAGAILVHKEQIKEKIKAGVHPNEFGVGRPGGAEIYLRYTQSIFDLQPTGYILSLDLKNAFNSIPVQQVMEAVLEKVPELAPYTFTVLGGPRSVTFTDQHSRESYTVTMTEGVDQGNPASPALFALTFSKILGPIFARHPGLDFAGFFDDWTVSGPLSLIGPFLVDFQASIPAPMLLQLAKCVLLPGRQADIIAGQQLADQFGMRLATDGGIKLVGAYVGTDQYITSQLEAHRQRFRDSLSLILAAASAGTDNVQTAYRVMRMCMTQTLTHLSRCTPSRLFEGLGETVNRDMQAAVCELLQISGDQTQGQLGEILSARILLPIRLGGMGITDSAGISPAAYLGSLHLTSCAVRDALPAALRDRYQEAIAANFTAAVDRLRNKIQPAGAAAVLPPDDPRAVPIPEMDDLLQEPLPGMQRSYTVAINKQQHSLVMQMATNAASQSLEGKVHCTSLLSCTDSPVASGFLTAAGGVKHRTTRLFNQQFITQCQIRLCARVMHVPPDPDGKCKHGYCSSLHGTARTAMHALRCMGISKYPRHQLMMGAMLAYLGHNRKHLPADLIFSGETGIDRLPYPLQPNKDVPMSKRAGVEGPKRADAVITMEGATYVYDAVISCPQWDQNVATAAAAAEQGYRYKWKFYTDHLVFAETQKKYVCPLSWDSFGKTASGSMKHLKQIGEWIAGNDKALFSSKMKQLYESLSTALARGNTAMVSAYYSRYYPRAAPAALGAVQ